MIAEADVTLSRGGVDVDAETTHRALPFEEGDVLVRLGVLYSHPQVEARGLEDESLLGNPEGRDGVVLAGVEHVIVVCGEPLAEMDVVAVAAEALAAVWLDDDLAFIDRLEDFCVGKDHWKSGVENIRRNDWI